MTAVEQQLSPIMRDAIRTLRKKWFSVEVEDAPVVDGLVRVMVQPTKADEPRPRVMWEDEYGNVFHQSRTKINGHYGPTLRVDDEDKTPPPAPPKRALRRRTAQRLREEAVHHHITESPSLWAKRAEINNRLTIANSAFSREPSRMNLMVLQAARTALNMIDEQISEEFESVPETNV